jgi:uncharacterized protein YecT (DUF1311 family)
MGPAVTTPPVRRRNVQLIYGAMMLLSLTCSVIAGDDDAVRPGDRAVVAACLKIAAAASRDDVASPTEGKTDPAAWIAYYARTPRPGPSNCVGVVSSPCLQRDPGGASGNRVDMLDCLVREQKVWDERLNAAYNATMQACQGQVCVARRNLERAWIAYRNALCELPYAERGGTFASVDSADCLLGETARQVIWLEAQK